MNSKRNSKRQYKSKTHKNLQRPSHRGGAIYSFDLTDKIGGLPARVPLNGTADGDCPATDTADLGFVNYGMTRSSGGARRRHGRTRKSKTARKSSRKTSKSRKSKRNTSRK
jgi:hypothetical protein